MLMKIFLFAPEKRGNRKNTHFFVRIFVPVNIRFFVFWHRQNRIFLHFHTVNFCFFFIPLNCQESFFLHSHPLKMVFCILFTVKNINIFLPPKKIIFGTTYFLFVGRQRWATVCPARAHF